jgi:polyisoprenoid-binding protein YceI
LSGAAGRVTVELSGNSIGRFRVREQFARVSLPNDAVGTTKKVAGSVVFDGSGAVLANQSKITVDLLSLISDEDERDEFLRTNSLESEKFPLAELVVRETPGMPWPIHCQGEADIQLVGDLTVHGVTSSLTWDATVQFRPDAIKGLMKTSFPFSTFDMKKPRKLFLLSVDDNIRLELQFDAPVVSSP